MEEEQMAWLRSCLMGAAVLFPLASILAGCDDGPGEETGEAMDDAAEETGDAAEDATD
jgi:hypothetical protein